MSADYGYINARVRGLKSKLLGSEFFSEALDASDYNAFLSSLAQSSYMKDLEEAQARYSGLKVLDVALGRNFYNTSRSILNFSDGEANELISLMLLRYDLYNIKAIARAKHSGRDLEAIQDAFFPAGELKLPILETIASAPDMAGVAQALLASPSPLKTSFARAAQQYSSDADLYKLELELDRAYYKIISGKLKDMDAPDSFVRHTKREIDATNLRTALKLQGSESSDDLFVSGGKEISRAIFDAVAAENGLSSLQILAPTSFAKVIEAQNLGEAEGVIRDLLNASAKRLAADPLGIGVVANYLRMKETEAAKLRLLARGKFYNVPRETLAKELGDG